MNIYVFTHHDIDGLTSAALVSRALKNPNIKFISQDPNEDFPVTYADEAYIVDVAVTQKTWGSLQNIKAEKITWIDHHKPFAEISSLNIPKNVQLVIDPTSPSACLMVQKFFNLNDETSQKIAELGTKADTWQLEPLVQEWMNLDSAYSFMKKDKLPLIEALARGKFEISGEMKEILEKYRTEKEEAKKELIKNTFIYNVRGHSIAIGFSPAILSGSESADFILKETNSEVQIVLKEEGWVSFRRRKDSKVNLIELAKLFGGGGHEYAAGGELGKTVTLESFPEVANEIILKISSVLYSTIFS